MSITGIDRITYGVADLAEGRRFFVDWGLHPVSERADGVDLETQDGATVALRLLDDPALPAPFEDGSTLREVTWGVEAGDSLDDIAARLSTFGGAMQDDDGVLRAVDPNGMGVAFRNTRRRAVDARGARVNTVDQPAARVNERSPVYDRAWPVKIGHVVFFTPNLEETESFYVDGLGFHVSDRYPGRGVFLRCNAEGGHHDLFLLKVSDTKRGLNHVAFTVRDLHEVFGGGLHISRCGWTTQVGPGRHPISSAYFWYVSNPCGGLAEYYADEDYLTGDWRPREDWDPTPENYAEWAITGGLDARTRRQLLPE